MNGSLDGKTRVGAGQEPQPRSGAELEAENSTLWAVLDAIREISGEIELDVLIRRTMDLAASLVKADRGSLFMYDREKDELWSRIAQGLDTLEIRMPAGKGLAGSCARDGVVINVPNAYEDGRFNRDVDRRTGYQTRSVLCVPVKNAHGNVLAIMQVLNRLDGQPFSDVDESMLCVLGGHLAAVLENSLLYESVEKLFESFVRASSTAIDDRDRTTAGHSKRVARYAINLARAAHDAGLLRFTRPRLKQLRYAALLHDFGKIGVRESVLTKSGKLSDEGLALVEERVRRLAVEAGGLPVRARTQTGNQSGEGPLSGLDAAGVIEFVRRTSAGGFLSDEDAGRVLDLGQRGLLTPGEVERLSVRRGNLTPAEWKDMQSHVDRGRKFLGEIPWPEGLDRVPDIAHRHHEKLDGTGYPRGLSGGEIDDDARILEVADIYDALTAQDRPYKPAIPHDKARAILTEMADKGQLDAGLVRLFFEHNLHKFDMSEELRVITQAE